MSVQRAQKWSVSGYERNARFVAELGSPLIGILNPVEGERILDVGCGDGFLTEKISEAGATVVGVDTSKDLLDAARARGVSAQEMDGQRLEFVEEFDAVFSNAALHWMPDAGGVAAGVARALKSGGRFVGEFGGHGNVAAIVSAIYGALRINGLQSEFENPWFFPTAEEYGSLLEQHGFRVQEIALLPRPTPLPTGIEGWLETFAEPMLNSIGREKSASVLNTVIQLLEPTLKDRSGNWTADYVRLRFAARKP